MTNLHASFSLHMHRILVRVALSAVNLFAWIFIFQFFFAKSSNLNHALLQTVLLYALSQDITLLLTPYSAERLGKGIATPMRQGIASAILAFSALAAAFAGFLGTQVALGILAFAILRGVYRALYWVPYQVDVSKLAESRPVLGRMQETLVALMPALCGVILTAGLPGVDFILFGAVALLSVALLFLFKLPNYREPYSWGYIETFLQFIDRRHRTLVLIAVLDGAAGAALLLFWPIAVFLIVGWSYAMLGIVMTLTFLLVYLTRGWVVSFFKKARIENSALVHALVASSSWILRLVVSGPLGVVLVDSYFYSGNHARGTGVDVTTFEQVADRGSYLDEYTVLKEMGIATGKMLMCVVGSISVALTSLPVTFIGVFLLAAICSGASVYLTHRTSRPF